MDIICFLTVKEFGYIKVTCNHFNKLICHGMQSIIRMNRFWKIQSLRLCSSIPYNYNTNDWHTFYFQMYKILQFGDYHNAQHYKNLVQKYNQTLPIMIPTCTSSRPSMVNSGHGAGGGSMPALLSPPLWLDRNVNPAWVNDLSVQKNYYLIGTGLTDYAYFVSNNIKSENKNNRYDGDTFTHKQQQIKDFMERYGMKVKDLNRERFNSERFNQSLPIKLVTDDYGFDLQLIDLICYFDAQLVLDMLLLKNENDQDKDKKDKDKGNGGIYDVYYKFKPKHNVTSHPDAHLGKNFTDKYWLDALTLFYDYSAKHGSIKVFKYLIKRFGISSVRIVYLKDYILKHHPIRYMVGRVYEYALTNILVAAMEGGNDEIINEVLNHPKLQFVNINNKQKNSKDSKDSKESKDTEVELQEKLQQKSKLEKAKEKGKYDHEIVKIFKKDSDQYDGNYGACQLFIGYSNWKNVKISTIELIIDKFSKYINKSKRLKCPLHFLIECNKSSEYHRKILKTMLESSKIDVNVKNSQSYTPFLFACTKNTHKQIMKLLLESNRVDKFVKDKYNRNAIHLLLMDGRYQVVEQIYYFMKNKIDNDDDNSYSNDCSDVEDEENAKQQKDSLFDLFNSQETKNLTTPYILACRSLNKIKYITRRRFFELLIDECKVDTSIVDDKNLPGSHYVTYDDKLKKWLISHEKLDAINNSKIKKKRR